jgi:1-acyl-sn-glycerol-3-phosphate acyltransferase
VSPEFPAGISPGIPGGKKFPGLGRIRVHFGEPILPGEFADRAERDLLAEVERRVRECQAELRRQPG